MAQILVSRFPFKASFHRILSHEMEKVSGANLLSMETWKPTDGPLDVK
jgi:hypothetical protein